MAEASRFTPAQRNKSGTLLAAGVAGQQWGVIGSGQLEACRVTRSMATRWRKEGRLHPLHPGVYALGHPSVPFEGRLVAALLYAGDGVVLSHATAAWWWGLTDSEPRVLELSCLRGISPTRGVVFHERRRFDHTRHRRFPITTIPQTLLDYATGAALIDVRCALARADYLRRLDTQAIEAVLGQGRPGTARLRAALGQHEPKLARTRSRLEILFIPLCESAGIPTPEINVVIEGWLVDAVWLQERVVVELDGLDNHRTRAQIERDRRKELELRRAGYVVLRYTWPQVTESPELVVADLTAALLGRPSSAVRSA